MRSGAVNRSNSMIQVMKNQGKTVHAYRLGQSHPVLDELMNNKQIVDLHNGSYEVFSQEAVNGNSGHGQLAEAGDWVRIDGAGYPYPSRDDWFRANLRHCGGDSFEQIPKALTAWTADQPMCPEVQFLIAHKGLVIDETNSKQYFSAILWGTLESAQRDAVLVFYCISRDEAGNIIDADFNFVERAEFDRTYTILCK